eukprot:CAMPEP_0182427272 /NCGR_PEP_ID=MMETSP1167-20130531/16625_1 /TAXON_ID=2988 /ORGANISM="Mallomonas Sp, Strain CCMP3275" /LENGTH=112 /DNA_ID=CAMNT_0024609395 /DNA_START=169 /DNA_END=504 /DNA_ORIENTATION=-
MTNNSYYYPPTYSSDGFIHATALPNMLLDVANHFYKGAPGDWICVEISPSLLDSPVIYEAAAPVGDKKAYNDSCQKFPHIYGGIPRRSVVNVFSIYRDTDGTFLSISKSGTK